MKAVLAAVCQYASEGRVGSALLHSIPSWCVLRGDDEVVGTASDYSYTDDVGGRSFREFDERE